MTSCKHGNSYPAECVQCAHEAGYDLALEEAAEVADGYRDASDADGGAEAAQKWRTANAIGKAIRSLNGDET